MDQWRRRAPFDVTLELGQACDFPFHVFTAPHMLLHGGNLSTFVAAVRETIIIGGENANRGSFLGSIIAASACTTALAKGDNSGNSGDGGGNSGDSGDSGDGGDGGGGGGGGGYRSCVGRGDSREGGGVYGESVVPLSWQNKTTLIDEIRSIAEAIADGGSRSRRASYTSSYTAVNTAVNTASHTTSTTVQLNDQLNERLGNAPGCIAHSNHTTSNATRPPSNKDDIAALRDLYVSFLKRVIGTHQY